MSDIIQRENDHGTNEETREISDRRSLFFWSGHRSQSPRESLSCLFLASAWVQYLRHVENEYTRYVTPLNHIVAAALNQCFVKHTSLSLS